MKAMGRDGSSSENNGLSSQSRPYKLLSTMPDAQIDGIYIYLFLFHFNKELRTNMTLILIKTAPKIARRTFQCFASNIVDHCLLYLLSSSEPRFYANFEILIIGTSRYISLMVILRLFLMSLNTSSVTRGIDSSSCLPLSTFGILLIAKTLIFRQSFEFYHLKLLGYLCLAFHFIHNL